MTHKQVDEASIT